MGRLIEDKNLRDRVRVFRNRAEAGKMLVLMLSDYKSSDAIVLGIPAGGVPVAYEIAKGLGLRMDMLIVRKVQIPGNTEAGFGAVGPDGAIVLNEELVRQLCLTDGQIKQQVEKTKQVIEKRNILFRKGRPFPDLSGKTAILTDDGLASGYTMLEAVRFAKIKGAKKIVVAVPTAPLGTINKLHSEVDELYCLNVRNFFRFAVAEAYEEWYDLGDDEVISIMNSAENINL